MAQALVNRAKNRGRGRPKGMGRAAHASKSFQTGVDLFMDCIDEDLSDAQKKEFRSQEKAYEAAKSQIDKAKANNAIVKFFDSPLTLEELEKYKAQVVSVPVVAGVTQTEPNLPEQITPGRRPQRKSALNARTVIALDEKDEDDDVIIVDSEPIRGGPGPRGKAKGKRGKNQKDPPFVPPVAVQSSVQRQTGGTPNAVVPGQLHSNQPIALPPGVTFNNLAQVLAPNGVAVQYMYQTQQGGMVQGPPPSSQSPTHSPGASLPQAIRQVVPGTHGLGVKRAAGVGSEEPQPKKRQNKNSKAKASPQPALPANVKPTLQTKPPKKKEEEANWVPLDEYYYSKQEGDPAYREEKGEFRFKCWYCHKMLYNNVRIMMHMQGHIDNDKQQHLDLSDLTQCKHCYKQFDTPFEMQSHVEKVHQNTSNVLVCRICEKDHETQVSLRQHMKASHNACEMPYICQLCNFRSSVYNDVVDHFKKRHDSSHFALCLYCLKVFKMGVSKSSGWALTSQYYQHLQKHQIKSATKKCSCCKLTFLNKQEAKSHKQRDHLPNFRGAISASLRSHKEAASDVELVMIKVPSVPGEAAGRKVKSLNAPVTSKVQLLQGIVMNGLRSEHDCYECQKPMNIAEHFKKYVECSLCRYATTCSYSYSAHMMGFHSGSALHKWKGVPKERELDQTWYCLCGFSTNKGNWQAYHLVTCSKRTAYQRKPEQKFFEYDDEQEEFNPFEPYGDEGESQEQASPEKETPSLFGALGLVRKQDKSAFSGKGVVAKKSTGGVPKTHNPALMSYRAPESEPIPPELTGSRKWSTVKIQDEKVPSKDSVFLGASKVTEDSDSSSRGDEKATTENGDAEMRGETENGEKSARAQEDAANYGKTDVKVEDTVKAGDSTSPLSEEKMDATESSVMESDKTVCNTKEGVANHAKTAQDASDIVANLASSERETEDNLGDDTQGADGDEEPMEVEDSALVSVVESAEKQETKQSDDAGKAKSMTEKEDPNKTSELSGVADVDTAVDTTDEPSVPVSAMPERNKMDPVSTDSYTGDNDPEAEKEDSASSEVPSEAVQEAELGSEAEARNGENIESPEFQGETTKAGEQVDTGKALDVQRANKEVLDERQAAEQTEDGLVDNGANEEVPDDRRDAEETGDDGLVDNSANEVPDDRRDAEETGDDGLVDNSANEEVPDDRRDAEETEDNGVMDTDEAADEQRMNEEVLDDRRDAEETKDGDLVDNGEAQNEATDLDRDELVEEEETGDKPEDSDEEIKDTREEAGEDADTAEQDEEKPDDSAERAETRTSTEEKEEQWEDTLGQTEEETKKDPHSEEKRSHNNHSTTVEESTNQDELRETKEKNTQNLPSENTNPDLKGNELSQTQSVPDPAAGSTYSKPEDSAQAPSSSPQHSSSKSHGSRQQEPSPRNADGRKRSSDSRVTDTHKPSSSYSRHESGSHHGGASRDRDGSYDRSDRWSGDYRRHDDRSRHSDNRRDDWYGGGSHHRSNYRDDYRNRDNRYGGGGYNRDRYGSGGGYQQNRQDNRNSYDHRQGGGYHRNDNYNKRGWGRGGGHYGGGGGYGYY